MAASGQKNVDLVIRARDETQRALNSAKTALDRFAAAQRATAARRDLYANTAASAKELAAAADAAAAKVNQLGQATRGGTKGPKALRAQFEEAREEARRLKTEVMGLIETGGRMNGRIGQQGSLAGFDARRAALEAESRAMWQVDTAAENMAASLPAIAAAQDRVTTSTVRATGAVRGQAAAVGDFAQRETAAIASRKGRGFLGLRPFELQNLSYQINDVITQLGSGTAPMQVFAQQGGQIAQLFPRVITGFIRLAPVIGLVTLALAPFLTALARVNNEAQTLKDFDRLLMRSGEGASYTSANLTTLAQRLDKYGGSLKDAKAALTEFVGDSVAPEYLELFGKTALDMAKVLKIDVADAAKKVSDAFTGNADAVLALDDELNFLTDSERKHAEALRAARRDADLRTYAFDKFARRYGETAATMRGPWTTILNNFGAAWSRFVDMVNFIDFGKAVRQIDGLINRIARLTEMLPGANKATLGAARATYLRNFQEIERIEDAQAAARAAGTLGQGGNATAVRAQAERAAFLRRENLDLQRRIREMAAAEAPPTNLPSDTTLDPPATSVQPSTRDRATDAEQLAEAQAKFVEGLIAENAAREFQQTLIGQSQRAAEIAEAVRTAELAAAEVKLTLTDEQRAAIERTTGALYDAQVAQRAFDQVSASALELAERRGEVEERAAFITRRLAEENLTAAHALYGVRADQLGQEYDLAKVTRDRAAAEKLLTDQVAYRAQIMEQIQFYEDTGQQALADGLYGQLVAVNEQIVAAAQNMLTFWAAASGPEADAARLRLQGVIADAQRFGQVTVTSSKAIAESLAQGATSAFDRFADAVASGQNVITSLRDAFLQFAADFLRQIAQMIIKQMVLNAVQASGGGKGGGGGPAAMIANAVNMLFRHSGGLITRGGGKPVPLAALSGATRYHTGGVVGLKPNERHVVAELGEEMLTENDPRHRNNLGKAGGTKILNLFDAADMLANALKDERGQEVIFNHVRNNPSAWRAAMGI